MNGVCCLYVGLITRPEEFYRLWCVQMWLCILDNEQALAHCRAVAPWGKNQILIFTCDIPFCVNEMNTIINQIVPLLHGDIQTLRSNKDTGVETELHVIILIFTVWDRTSPQLNLGNLPT